MRRRTLVLVSSALLLAVGTAAIAGATTLQVGAADGANAVFVFDQTAKPRVKITHTAQNFCAQAVTNRPIPS